MFVFHTQFNILSWIFGTFLFHVVLILKKSISIYILFSFFTLELFTGLICLKKELMCSA